jgi:hypothetical protein
MLKKTIIGLALLSSGFSFADPGAEFTAEDRQFNLHTHIEKKVEIEITNKAQMDKGIMASEDEVLADSSIDLRMYSNMKNWEVKVQSQNGFVLRHSAIDGLNFGSQGAKLCSAYSIPYQLAGDTASLFGASGESLPTQAVSNALGYGAALTQVDCEAQALSISDSHKTAKNLFVDPLVAEPSKSSAGVVGDESGSLTVKMPPLKARQLHRGVFSDVLTFSIEIL